MPTTDYTPELTDVGAFVRTRTRTAAGRELGTFNDASHVDTPTETRPIAEQVDILIRQGVDKVEGAVGPDIPDGPDTDDTDSLRKLAKDVAALYAAMLVELTYFPEQVNTNRSNYPQLKDLFDENFSELVNGVQAVGGAAIDPTGSAADHPLPKFNFPDSAGMITLRTRF